MFAQSKDCVFDPKRIVNLKHYEVLDQSNRIKPRILQFRWRRELSLGPLEVTNGLVVPEKQIFELYSESDSEFDRFLVLCKGLSNFADDPYYGGWGYKIGLSGTLQRRWFHINSGRIVYHLLPEVIGLEKHLLFLMIIFFVESKLTLILQIIFFPLKILKGKIESVIFISKGHLLFSIQSKSNILLRKLLPISTLDFIIGHSGCTERGPTRMHTFELDPNRVQARGRHSLLDCPRTRL